MNILGPNLGGIVDLDGTRHDGEKMWGEAMRRGLLLTQEGVVSGDRVLITHGGSANFFVDLIATWYVGGCALCVNEKLSEYELRKVIEFAKPKILLSAKEQEIDSGDVRQYCMEVFNRTIQKSTGSSKYGSFGAGQLDQQALVLFTSGTTGVPKGVVHTYRSLLARLQINRQYIGVQKLRRTLCPLPTHFGHGLIGNCLTPWFSGGDVFLYPLTDLRVSANIGEYIDEHEITFLSSVPSMWHLFSRVSKPPHKKSLKQINIGSAPLSKQLWETVIEWSGTKSVSNMYGITETANWIGGASALECDPEDGLVGNIWAGSVAVLQESGAISAVGKGELLVQTMSLMQGYLDQEHLTNDVMIGGFFKTGDIGRVDKHGIIRLIGRKSFEINRAGVKINPEELDNLVEKNKNVSAACTFSVPDDIAGELVGIAVVFQNDQFSELENRNEKVNRLKSWLKQHIIQEKMPDYWYILPEIPTTDRGKVDRPQVATLCRVSSVIERN